MCLAIPGRVEEIFESEGLKMARINFGGIRKSACLEYAPEAVPGDYVLVHVGFAISIINEAEAERTLKLLEESGDTLESEIEAEISSNKQMEV